MMSRTFSFIIFSATYTISFLSPIFFHLAFKHLFL
uniref:Uncharacterized protein n=1 Tax=Rhizophora mucronata TaxID=61149 RepID=A0A2P2IH86_RHIMU